MTDSKIPFQLIVVAHIWIFLTFLLMIVPAQTNDPGIPLIRFQLPFMLPFDNQLGHLPPSMIPHKFLNQSIMILRLYIPSWVITLFMTRSYYSSLHDVLRCYKKRVYIAPCVRLTTGFLTVMDLLWWVQN